MKKFYFFVVCLAIVGLMTAVSSEIDWGFADKNDEFCVAAVAVFLTVLGAAVKTDLIRGIFFAAGLLSTIWFLGGEATLVYLFGCVLILLFMHRWPEVQKMVAKLWEPDKDDDEKK